MKPPICALCGKRFGTVSGDSLVSFSDYKPLPDGTVGHPHGLAWFCPEHIDAARAFADLPTAEAMKRLREKH